MRSLSVLSLLLVTALALAGCSGSGGDPDEDAPEVKEIAMHNQMYEPSTVTVAKGGVLRFEAHDTAHTAQTTDGMFNTGRIEQGTSRDVVMGTAGTFVFHCQYHSKMQLTATVTG